MRSIYILHTYTHIRSQLHHAIVFTACSAMQSFRIHAASIICHMRLHTMNMRIHNCEINLYTTHTHTHIRSQLHHAIVLTACSAMQSFRIHAASIIICHMRLHTMNMRIHNREINLYTTHTHTHFYSEAQSLKTEASEIEMALGHDLFQACNSAIETID